MPPVICFLSQYSLTAQHQGPWWPHCHLSGDKLGVAGSPSGSGLQDVWVENGFAMCEGWILKADTSPKTKTGMGRPGRVLNRSMGKTQPKPDLGGLGGTTLWFCSCCWFVRHMLQKNTVDLPKVKETNPTLSLGPAAGKT